MSQASIPSTPQASTGYLSEIQDPGSTTRYNSAGQLTASALLNLTWDAAGRISRITQQHMLPTASAITPQQASLASVYSYDATGALKKNGDNRLHQSAQGRIATASSSSEAASPENCHSLA